MARMCVTGLLKDIDAKNPTNAMPPPAKVGPAEDEFTVFESSLLKPFVTKDIAETLGLGKPGYSGGGDSDDGSFEGDMNMDEQEVHQLSEEEHDQEVDHAPANPPGDEPCIHHLRKINSCFK